MSEAVEALERVSLDPVAARLARDREEGEFFLKMRLTHSFKDGEAKGKAEGKAEGKADALRSKIAQYCGRFDIELTPERQAQLDASATDLDELLDGVAFNRRWPE